MAGRWDDALAEESLTVGGKGFPADKPPAVVVCCGLPASGKSWFASTLAAEKGYVRVCQDELKSRSACEDVFCASVRNRQRVVVDRCNPTVSNRDGWLALAHYPKDAVCVYFSANSKICSSRAEARKGSHPSLSSSGRIKAALSQFSKEMQVPDVAKEKFSCVFVVPSFEAGKALLSKHFAVPESALESRSNDASPRFFKFPRTKHLFSLGAATRDDLVMGASDRAAFFNPQQSLTLTLEEKVDGANIGISLDADHQLRVQNRSHFVNSKYHIQFKALDWWLQEHSADLHHILAGNSSPGRLVLFGEWLAATHSVPYNTLPDKFLAFDIFDSLEGKFFSRRRFREALEGTAICPVPVVDKYTLPLSEEAITHLLHSSSMFGDVVLEGVYLRLDEEPWLLERAKVVRADFIAGNDHWDKGRISWNRIISC